ncbi:TPA: DNA polymerase [Candidatus Bipolaricaulota bacterium]|nr:DNA polymerase [Candidatus Bipolaricaulota bacterium]
MPTALELTREGWKSYLKAVRHRPAPPEPTLAERRERERLLARIREAAAALKARFGVRRVVLFGSLAHEAWFVPDSDVDLAVEGLAGDDYWAAWRLVEEVIGDRLVDLIEIEVAGESLRRAIERYGVEL